MKKLLPFLFVIASLFPILAQAQTCVIPTGGTINGSANGCSDRTSTYTITGVVNATTYNWVITGAQGFTKVSNTEYSIVFGSSNVSIQITPINDTNGPCSGTVISKTVTVTVSLAKPVISQTGSVLNTSTAATSYQWYAGSAAISGAILQSYTPAVNGLYTVEVKNAAGCSTFSDQFNFIKSGVKEDARFKTFSFYPNPIDGAIHTNFIERYDLEFFDSSGRKILQNQNLIGDQETDLSSLNKGIYIMRINSGNKNATRKIIIR
jgi:hypothetical protein